VVAHHGFDLVGVDVEAAGDDHFLDARDQFDPAVRLQDGHVAGAEPAVVERALVGLGAVEVAGKDLRAAREQLAGFAVGHGARRVVRAGDADFGVGKRQADVVGAPCAVEGGCQPGSGRFRSVRSLLRCAVCGFALGCAAKPFKGELGEP